MDKKTEELKLALEDVYETIIKWDEGGGKRSRRELARRIVALAESAQQEPVAYAVYHRMGGSKSLHWPEQHSDSGDHNQYQLVPLYTSPPAQQQEPITGWIAWQGGECPVDKGAIVDVRYRYDPNTVAHLEVKASNFQWQDTGSTTDIVSFRVRGFAALSSPPASKPWVGLTDDEIELLRHDLAIGRNDIKVIEEKLRSKNA